MNKITIMPKVVVYRDLLSDEEIENLYSVIKDSEDYLEDPEYAMPEDSSYQDKHGTQPARKEDGSLIYKWSPWYTFGTKSIFGQGERTDSNYIQHDCHQLIINTLRKVHNDYVKDWSEVGAWTYKILDWRLDVRDNDMSLSPIEILKHRTDNMEEYAINVHTDWHEHRLDEPGPKQIMTYTIYLNDDYEGGEIDFIDEDGSEVITYKPKRGDITVFPSGRPYWHAARGVKSGPNKLFLRLFSVFSYGGSKEWQDGAKAHGVTAWMEIQNKKIKDYIDAGNVGRQVVFKGDEPDKLKNLVPIFIEHTRYIDGRQV